MNELERQRLQAAGAKLRYPPGTRVELIHMEDAYAPVPPGTRGTVEMVDDAGQLVMAWDNGRAFLLFPAWTASVSFLRRKWLRNGFL